VKKRSEDHTQGLKHIATL